MFLEISLGLFLIACALSNVTFANVEHYFYALPIAIVCAILSIILSITQLRITGVKGRKSWGHLFLILANVAVTCYSIGRLSSMLQSL